MTFRDLQVSEIIKNTYKCECGLTHDPGLESVYVEKEAMDKCVDFILKKSPKKLMVICDQITYEVAGKEIINKLEEKGQTALHYILPQYLESVVPDNRTLGEVYIRMPLDIDMFLAVGSGVVNDITRNLAYHLQKDFVAFGTAPSMDGYASITSALIINNLKESCPGKVPIAIFADIDILKNAPYTMLTAGFGDVLAKYNAVREWQLGRDVNKEHYCDEIAQLIWNAADKCSMSASLLKNRDEKAVKNVMDALILSGIAMGMYTNTRPGSGAEHHLVHYWDVEYIKRGWEHPLHGNSVGVGLCVINRLYDLVEKELDIKVMALDTEKIEGVLLEAGCEISPKKLGIPEDIFEDSIIHGHIMSSSKYTILTHLDKFKKETLKRVAKELRDYYYD